MFIKRAEREYKCGESTGRLQAWGEGQRDRPRTRDAERTREEGSDTCSGGPLNHLYEGSPSGLPLAHHLASSGLESTFGLTQGSPLCVHGF